jgi:hypothetical protein
MEQYSWESVVEADEVGTLVISNVDVDVTPISTVKLYKSRSFPVALVARGHNGNLCFNSQFLILG